MDTSVKGGRISFTTAHNSYYALAEQVETDDSGKPSDRGDGTTPSGDSSGKDSPKTGDDSAAALWMGMMIISAILVACGFVLYKKRKHNHRTFLKNVTGEKQRTALDQSFW